MTASGWAALALAGLGAGLGLALWHARRSSGRLRRRLDVATRELERLSRAFGSFAPHAVVEQIIASGVSTAGERKEVTALFSDLVGFTAIAERADPADLVRVLNGYFERMSRAITEHHGHISTLIGDGILALFGGLEPNPWHADDAVHAALGMRVALADYNRELAAQGLPALAQGVGLHRGIGVAGLVGSRDLLQFTVVGRIVNVAARVQALTRERGCDILITESVREVLDPRFALRALPAGPARGLAEPVHIFAVEGFEPAHASGMRS